MVGRSRAVKGGGRRSGQAPRTATGAPPDDSHLRGVGALSVLDTALNALDAPAFVVDLGGEVLHANTNAQVLLDRDGARVALSLSQAIAGAPRDSVWDLMPLRGSEQPRGFLAILRSARHQVVVFDDLLRGASRRWHLTARQTEVLRWVAQGLTNVSVAETLGISERTVEFHLKIIFDKAGVDNRATLIAKVMER
jgi:DNA-binding CsgD family transcriptional regulator